MSHTVGFALVTSLLVLCLAKVALPSPSPPSHVGLHVHQDEDFVLAAGLPRLFFQIARPYQDAMNRHNADLETRHANMLSKLGSVVKGLNAFQQKIAGITVNIPELRNEILPKLITSFSGLSDTVTRLQLLLTECPTSLKIDGSTLDRDELLKDLLDISHRFFDFTGMSTASRNFSRDTAAAPKDGQASQGLEPGTLAPKYCGEECDKAIAGKEDEEFFIEDIAKAFDKGMRLNTLNHAERYGEKLKLAQWAEAAMTLTLNSLEELNRQVTFMANGNTWILDVSKNAVDAFIQLQTVLQATVSGLKCKN